MYNIHDPTGVKWMFQLRVGLSSLKSHKKSHNFADTPNDTCQCSLNAETTQHFLLDCPNFNAHRRELFQIVNPILVANSKIDLNDRELVHLLLYGNDKFTFHENQIILKATMTYIGKTSRFTQT